MAQRVLIVEDDSAIAELIAMTLRVSGCEPQLCYDGLQAVRLLTDNDYDLAILDVMLPGMNGFSLCETIRRTDQKIGIIILSAKGQEQDKIRGLSIGADDYMTKPFSPRELVARVRAVLRRVEGPKLPNEIVSAGPLRIDVEGHAVELDGTPVELTPTEFELLLTLARRPGQVLSRERLIEEALGYDSAAGERTVDAHIKNLRRKVEPDPANPRYIVTVVGLGYKLAS